MVAVIFYVELLGRRIERSQSLCLQTREHKKPADLGYHPSSAWGSNNNLIPTRQYRLGLGLNNDITTLTLSAGRTAIPNYEYT
jgi:hypothetical protein